MVLRDAYNGVTGFETDFRDLSNDPPIKVSLNHDLSDRMDTRIDVGMQNQESDSELAYAASVDEEISRFSPGDPSGDVAISDAGLDPGLQIVLDVPTQINDPALEQVNVTTTDVATRFAASNVYDVDRSLNAIFENAASGSLVGITAKAMDGQSPDTIRYELANDAAGIFTIDASTGVVTVANGQHLDREADSWHVIVVTATTDDDTRAYGEFIVTVLDVNDNPLRFTTSTHVVSGEYSLIATNITAIDPDLPGQPITYSIIGGPDASRFVIDPETGELRFLSLPDFEAPQDTDKNNVYVIEIAAVDNQGMSVNQAINVAVINENDLPLAGNDILYAEQDTQLLIPVESLISNDVDRDGDRLRVQLLDGPTFGTLIVNSDGTMLYQPDSGFKGIDSFTYLATDGNGFSNIATVEIQVSADSTLPVAKQATSPRPPAKPADPPVTEPGAEVDQPTASEISLLRDEGRIRDIQHYLRKRISSVMELFKRLPEHDADLRVDAPVIEPLSNRFEPSLPRVTSRTQPAIVSDRYRPPTISLLDQLDPRALDDQLDHMIETMSEQFIPDFAVAGATMTTAAMSLGYVFWTTRTGYMMASLVGTTPGWKQIDPLPILDFREVDEPIGDGDDRTDINRLLENPITTIGVRNQVSLSENVASSGE